MEPETPKPEVPKCLQPMEKLDFLDGIMEELTVESTPIAVKSLYDVIRDFRYPKWPRY
jgi:hypothetical protein